MDIDDSDDFDDIDVDDLQDINGEALVDYIDILNRHGEDSSEEVEFYHSYDYNPVYGACFEALRATRRLALEGKLPRDNGATTGKSGPLSREEQGKLLKSLVVFLFRPVEEDGRDEDGDSGPTIPHRFPNN